MTPEAQRIAIAQVRGYREFPIPHLNNEQKAWALSQEQANTVTLGQWLWSLTPNYLNDLNAMHEAWRSLTDEQSTKAAWMLVQVLDGFQTWTPDEYETLNVWEMSLNDISDCINATPAQYAEAFLRTLNLWKE